MNEGVYEIIECIVLITPLKITVDMERFKTGIFARQTDTFTQYTLTFEGIFSITYNKHNTATFITLQCLFLTGILSTIAQGSVPG